MTTELTLKALETAFVMIDVQDRINGAMTDQTHVPRIEVLIQACKRLGIPVITTEQYPKGLGPTVAGLSSLLDTSPLEKATFSCVREPAVIAAIEATGRQQLVVTGIEAHVCVLQTVLDLLPRGFAVHVPHDAVSSRRPRDRDLALDRMVRAGAVVTSTESALFELLERCGTDDFRAVSKLIKEIPV